MLHFTATFSCILISHLSIAPSLPALFPYLPLSFSQPLPISKEVNKKLSYHRCAQCDKKTHQHNSVGEHVLFSSVPQYRLAGGIMFPPALRASICPFGRSFVCLEGHEWSTSGVRRSQVKVNEDKVIFGSLAVTSFSIRRVE